MALCTRTGAEMLRRCLRLRPSLPSPVHRLTGCALPHLISQREKSAVYPSSYAPETSLSRSPWPEMPAYNPEEEEKQHQAVVQKVNGMLGRGEYGRLFAVVHFASRQWKVTNEDLIQVENHIQAECGERILLEKVLLVGGEEFTLIGKPLLSRDLVRVEATVIEKTESWPMAHMVFRKRYRFQRKRMIVQPQTILRINRVEVSPTLS